MSESFSVNHNNAVEIEHLMIELNISKMDRILFIGSDNLAMCLCLCKKSYEKLYLIDDKEDIYNYPYYTMIRYFRQKDVKLHFPYHFFQVIIANNSYPKNELIDFISSNGIIMVGSLSNDNETLTLDIEPGFAKIREVQILTENNCTLSAKKNSTTSKFQVLKAKTPQIEGSVPKRMDVICYSGKEEGICIHSKILKERLETEYGMAVNLTNTAKGVQSHFVVVEYHSSYEHFDNLLEDVNSLLNRDIKVILENHGSLKKVSERLKKMIDIGLVVTFRAPEIAEQDRIDRYSILPVLIYRNINVQKPEKIDGIRIGTFGFIGKQKGTEDIISLAFKLKVRAFLLLGINPVDPSAEKKIIAFERKYGKRKNISINIYNKQISYYVDGLVEVIIGNHTDKDIMDAMSKCSHIVFAHRTRMEESGTIKYAKRLSRPIFALDSFQSRLGQIYRFSKFTNLTPFRLLRESVIENCLAVIRRDMKLNASIRQIFRSIEVQLRALFGRNSPNKKSLAKMSSSNIRDEDGLDYLIAILKYMVSSQK